MSTLKVKLSCIFLFFSSAIFSSINIVQKSLIKNSKSTGMTLTKELVSSCMDIKGLLIINKCCSYINNKVEDKIIPLIPEKIKNQFIFFNNKINQGKLVMINTIKPVLNFIILSDNIDVNQVQNNEDGENEDGENDDENLVYFNLEPQHLLKALLFKKITNYSFLHALTLAVIDSTDKIAIPMRKEFQHVMFLKNVFALNTINILLTNNEAIQNFICSFYEEPFIYFGNPFLYTILGIAEALPVVTVQSFSNNQRKKTWQIGYLLSLLTLKLYLSINAKNPHFYLKSVLSTTLIMAFGTIVAKPLHIYWQQDNNEIIEENFLVATLPIQLIMLGFIEYFSQRLVNNNFSHNGFNNFIRK